MASGVIFSELHVLSGERQESSDLVGIAASPVLSLFKRRRGQLFTIVEPSLPDSEDVCRRLIETIEDEYFRDPGRSVTGSLRQAIVTANERLRSENSRSTPDRQLRAGLSCAVVRESDVFIAQVAPANAFILHGGEVKRIFSTYSVIPDVSSNGTNRASDSLGSGLDPQINLAYSPLDEGDLVVLASGAYWKLVPDRYILDAAKHVDPELSATELYGCYLAHARRPTTSMIVIRISEAPARHGRSNGNERQEEPRTALVEMSEISAVAERPAAPERTKPPERPKPFEQRPVAAPGNRQKAPSGNVPRGRAEPARRPSLWERLRPGGQKRSAPLYPPGPPLEEVGRSSVRLKRKYPQNWSDRRGAPSWIGKPILVLVLAAIFVLAGTFGINSWRSWQLGDPVALAQEAQQKRAQAGSAPDQAAARSLLAQSYELFSRSLRAKEDESIRTQAAEVLAELDRIDRIVRIDQVNTLVDYTPIVDAKGDVTQLALDGNNLYVMDEGLDRLYKYNLTADGKGVQDPGKHEVLVRRGDKLEGATVGDLLSLSWMPAGQLRAAPALFALESGRSILTYAPNVGLSRIEVSESQRWGSIQAINGFAGGLYLLDTKLKGVFYYPPTKNGYESEPYTIVDARSKVDLSQAVDIALDGNLYVLEASGTVKRFNREGRPLDFADELPDGPLKGPRALFASANTRSLYVLDTAGERIIQFSPEGKLQRQFKAGKDVSFKDLRDIFVDEGARRMYLLAHKSLFSVDLPPMQ
ncbi:MAG: hypothetical protein ACM3US_15195 [Sphingomonadaceae bacterium]